VREPDQTRTNPNWRKRPDTDEAVWEEMDREKGYSKPADETRTLPDAELAVLAAAMVWPDQIPLLQTILSAEDFAFPDHAATWEALCSIAPRFPAQHVDLATLRAEMVQRGSWWRTGGDEFLRHLVQDVPTTSSAFSLEERARLVADSARARRIEQAGVLIRAMARDWTVSVGELVAKASKLLGDAATSEGQSALTLAHDAPAFRDRMMAALEGRPVPRGVSTGLAALDEVTRGVRPGEVWIIAGRPAMGKSALVQVMAQRMAALGSPTLFLSLEMPRAQVFDRAVAMEARVPTSTVRDLDGLDCDLATKLDRAVRVVEDLPLYVRDDARRLRDVVTAIRAEKMRRGIVAAFVDYLQYVKVPGLDDHRERQVAIICEELKAVAKETGVAIVCAAQINRAVESRSDKRPTMADLRESGAIEQIGDVIALLYRDEYYDPSSADRGTAEVIFVKQRQGDTTTVKLRWTGETQRFDDLPADADQEPEPEPYQVGGWGDDP
jgi:replicative DNA helicase